MARIVIIGGKGTAVVVAEQIYDAQHRMGMDVEMLGFAFDDESFGSEINDFPILCKTYDAWEKYKDQEDVKFIFQLYRPDLMAERIKLRDSYNIPLERFYTFIHPSVYVAKSARIGHGNVILANSVVNPNAVVGNYNTFNSSCLIGHDTTIGDNNFSAGHVCIGSNIKIGNGAFFGLNASLVNFINVGDFAFIGMATNVVKDVGDHEIVVGNPGRIKTKLNKPDKDKFF